MRKLLLATVAVLAAGIGIAETAQAQEFPTPGTVTVRLNGRFRFYASIQDQSDANNNLQGPGDGLTPQTGTNKLTNYNFSDYGRLYPGFDGVAANGLKYGASLEIRTGEGAGAGFGQYGGGYGAAGSRTFLWLFRQWGYIGTDKLGTIRLGQTDDPSTLYATGTFENFNDGGWNGDVVFQLPYNLIPEWPFLDSGNFIPINRAIYLSPQLYGFDFGVSFAPNSGGGSGSPNSGCGSGSFDGGNFVGPAGPVAGIAGPGTPFGSLGANTQSIAGPGCDTLAATPTGDYSRPRNIFNGLLRYRGSFGAFGVAATAGYLASGTVAGNATPHQIPYYNGYSVGDFGLAVTYGGLSVGGHLLHGQINGGGDALNLKGGRPETAWLAGVSYTIGPVIVGANYWVDDSTGDINQSVRGSQLHEIALDVGGTYSLAPGLALFLDYGYGERRQHGYNFISGQDSTSTATGSASSTLHNKVTAQIIAIGTSFAW
ncbi:MAG: porin [Pseudomonadota bacterium]|nr:porin [Pseudomonadota bacterium]